MYIRRRRGWEIPESAATPEGLYFSRRELMGAGAMLAAASLAGPAAAQRVGDLPDPSAGLYPAARNPRYTLERPVTPEAKSSTVNNYYEFSYGKNVAPSMSRFERRPWLVKIDGLVDNPQELGIDDLLKKVQLEERLYRHRCVEAWSMAVPWTGFAMKDLVALAGPKAGAKYVRMETFLNPKVASNQRDFRYPWPYVEGLTLAEATNELAFLVTGVYGKPAPGQYGAPLRLVTPWKYGFKSIKGIVRFSFTDKQPLSFWEEVQGAEYGFWANVNPKVPHPRWSQASEEDIATGNRRPTELFNGYGEYVAGLYAGREAEKIWF
ncbi:UNVERIFIED_ORG: sulfoxide reductase catalytic subunit YedY [Xanthobacter viscosus]|jgi:sulfoxide reductase catalytic subunit YedY|uniref:Protein-methionine-sulfoxide reductase catalytic subunit MsrP n=1 Tax=Xanthobacter autotrophicus TaxID=280 RepID=A0A6C1KK08_XANAU|nr:protein-methionine-sulfoxide reductase catalytic subunit MsrP [Xanthobacter autotrophicus]TLX44648.1 protein-methionine-sulfoxide reductase catalytic subunit MsrP [Xanthobacter autotrophicus]